MRFVRSVFVFFNVSRDIGVVLLNVIMLCQLWLALYGSYRDIGTVERFQGLFDVKTKDNDSACVKCGRV